MTSQERREARYQRRCEKRQAKRNKKIKNSDNYESVFSFKNLYESYKSCRSGVSWKRSVQTYITMAPVNVYKSRQKLLNNTYKMPKYVEFDLFERGVARHITSMRFGDRVVNRCFSQYALVPVITRSFIDANCASRVGKGYDYAINKMTKDLQWHYRRYGNEGYILLFDFKKFFENVSHAVIKADLNRKFDDERLINFGEKSIDSFGLKGLGLGNQDSQIWALDSANRLDHYIKEVLRVKCYCRYMDDGYLIHPSKEFLTKCLDAIKAICQILGITLNQKKTQIVKLSHGFRWLKVRYYLTETGKVVRKIYKRSLTRMRRKLKALHRKYIEGIATFSQITTSFQCWLAYATKFHSYHTRNTLMSLFDDLFTEEMRYRKWNILKSSVKLVTLSQPRLLRTPSIFAAMKAVTP